MSQKHMITTMGEKGQVEIPQRIIKVMGLGAKTQLVMTYKDGAIIITKASISTAGYDLENIFKQMDAKNLQISDEEIKKEIKEYRKSIRN